MLGFYRSMLARRPFATQVVSSAVLFGVGDLLCQQGVEKKGMANQDWMRTARLVGYGGCVFGPVATQWYKVLARIQFSNPIATTVARVGVDQTVFASANLAFFLSSMAYLEGGDPKEKLRNTYISTLKTNWFVWPPVQAVNFAFVPLEHRVLVVNVVSIGWNCYLSYVNSGGGKSNIAQEAKAKLEEGKEKVQEKIS